MTLQSTFCSTLVDEFGRCGVRHAVISPGSRSSPLAIALLADTDIEVHVRLDERSACFFAIGLALESHSPTLIVTTSGTAAAELHAGVVEADLAGVPLIVLTADRPPELLGVGAAQTINQSHLYGAAARYFVDFGVPDVATRPHWRSLAARLVAEATAAPNGPGPVHANLPFREPLVGEVEEISPPSSGRGWHQSTRARAVDDSTLDHFLIALTRAATGVFVVGAGAFERDPRGLVALADALGWPILTDARGVARELFEPVIVHSDGILRSSAAHGALRPELICHFGAPHAGRVMESWLTRMVADEVPQLFVDPFGRFENPARAAGVVLGADPVALVAAALAALAEESRSRDFLSAWRLADDAAEEAIEVTLRYEPGLSEPAIARRLVELAPTAATIFSSSSMPIRDLEWFAPRRHGAPRILANRGANGIDGVTSTLLGVAASAATTGAPPVLGIIGDLAFLHDLSGLVWGSFESCPPATLVLVDNAGGGIFNFLAYPDLLGDATFERGFGTPQSVDLAAVIRAFGIPLTEVETVGAFDHAITTGIDDGVFSIVLCRTERRSNVALHSVLNEAIANAIDAAL